MGTQQFCLRWNNHQSNMLNVFDQLLQNGDFVDVTLACEGMSIKAHKMVLSACSPYFQNLFRDNPCKHPIVILKDMKYIELRSIIDFMYKGEINVSQDQLSTLLKTAETLKVKGLAEVSGGSIPGARLIETVSTVNEETPAAAPSAPSQNSPPQSQDGRASPHSKRKRHRPTRRPSSGETPSNESPPDAASYEMPAEPAESRAHPKSEPLEMIAEPPVDMLMDQDSRYQIEVALAERGGNHDLLDKDANELSAQLQDEINSSISQPSTSGMQSASQGSSFVPWVRMPCRSGPCKTWQEETMFSAVRSVLKLGMPLINVSRRFGIPYPTLFYYTNRVRQLLKPYEKEGATGSATYGFSRPPGKRGRPTKVYLGTWKDEDLTRAILRVVYKDYIPETIQSLLGSVAGSDHSWPTVEELCSSDAELGLEAQMMQDMECVDRENVPVESLIREMEPEESSVEEPEAGSDPGRTTPKGTAKEKEETTSEGTEGPRLKPT